MREFDVRNRHSSERGGALFAVVRGETRKGVNELALGRTALSSYPLFTAN